MNRRMVLSLVIALAAGCSGTSQPPIAREVGMARKNLNVIYRAYKMAERELNHPPQSQGELTRFLDKAGGSAESLESPNDEQPYEIIWGISLADAFKVKTKTPDPSDSTKNAIPDTPVLAYEKMGSEDGRLVLFVNGPVMLVQGDEFRQLQFADKRKPK